jgi:cell division protease FtsH
VNYREGEEHLFLGTEVTRTKDHSEKTAIEIDEEVRRILTECYEAARKVVEEHRSELEALSEALLRYESLTAEEAGAVLRGDTVEAVRRNAENRRKRLAAADSRTDTEPDAADDDVDDLEANGRFAY